MKIYSILLLICFLLGCRSSSSTQNWMANNGKPKVVSTTAMIDDIVGAIGGERIDHLALIRGEIDPHSYELVKGDEEKLSFAQVIFYNGLGLEHGASLRYQIDRHPCAISVGDTIRKQHPKMILLRGEKLDPHVWMDLILWSKIIDPIVEVLSKIDPEGTPLFKNNGAALKTKMEQLSAKIGTKLSEIPAEKRYLVTSHDAFGYFARRYLATENETESQRFRAPEGLAPDGQLSCSDIQGIIDHLCAYRIEVMFPESNVSKDSLRKILSACLEKGRPVRIASRPLYADALGAEGSNADSYLKMMEHNAHVLYEEWK